MKSLEQCKAEADSYEMTDSVLKLYYKTTDFSKLAAYGYLFLYREMYKNFGKSIDLQLAVNNDYFDYQGYDGDWHYAEKWLEPIEHFNNNNELFNI